MGARMLGVYGQIQRKGEVIHIIAKKLYDLSDMLASLGDQNQPFRIQHGRGDGVQNGGGPDRRGGKAPGLAGRDIYIPDLHIDTMKLKARDLR
jgi:error-prone DNA polymerase